MSLNGPVWRTSFSSFWIMNRKFGQLSLLDAVMLTCPWTSKSLEVVREDCKFWMHFGRRIVDDYLLIDKRGMGRNTIIHPQDLPVYYSILQRRMGVIATLRLANYSGLLYVLLSSAVDSLRCIQRDQEEGKCHFHSDC